jgi:hypothetical protein
MSFICLSTVDLGQDRVGKSIEGRVTRAYLARLAGTEQQHLNLILGHNLVPPELILNLVIACEQEVRWYKKRGEKETHGLWPLHQLRMTERNP